MEEVRKKTKLHLGVSLGWLVLVYSIGKITLAHGPQETFCMWFMIQSAIAVFIFAILFFSESKVEIEKKYFLITLILGIIYMLCFPPVTIPDENIHINTAYCVTNNILGYEDLTVKGEMLFRTEDSKISELTQDNLLETHEFICENFNLLNKENTFIKTKADILQPKVLPYFPAVIAMTLARILNLGCFPMLYLGRLFNLLFFATCVYFAIKKTPMGKNIFFAIGLLPMIIQQAASYSYDAVINGAAILMIATCLKVILQSSTVKRGDILGIVVGFICLIACKGSVYIFICGLILLFPQWKKITKKQYCYIACVGIVGIILFIVFKSDIIVNTLDRLASFVIPEMQEHYTILYIFHYPMQFCGLLIRTLILYVGFYAETMIGSRLGWLNIEIPAIIIIGYAMVLVLVSIQGRKEEYVITPRMKGMFASIIFCVLMAVELAAALWTPLSEDHIIGVQGRYFLPILPLLLLLLDNKRVNCYKISEKLLILTMGILQIATLTTIVLHIIRV